MSYDPFADPFMAKLWICLDCDINIQFENLKNHMRKTGHMDFLRDTYSDSLYPELSGPDWNEKSEQRKAHETVIKKISLNLPSILQHKSMRELDGSLENHDAIVVGAGPSLGTHQHLPKLAESNFNGQIILTDRILKAALDAGVTPDKFDMAVVTLDDKQEIASRFFNHDIVKKWIAKIKCYLAVNIDQNLVNWLEIHGAPIYWYHPMRDYNGEVKSFDAVFRLMFEAGGQEPLPLVTDGGNVGTCCMVIAHKILKAEAIILIGMDLSIKGDSKYEIEEADNIKRQQQQFDYYRKSFYHILKTYREARVINCTEGGSLTDEHLILNSKLENYLETC